MTVACPECSAGRLVARLDTESAELRLSASLVPASPDEMTGRSGVLLGSLAVDLPGVHAAANPLLPVDSLGTCSVTGGPGRIVVVEGAASPGRWAQSLLDDGPNRYGAWVGVSADHCVLDLRRAAGRSACLACVGPGDAEFIADVVDVLDAATQRGSRPWPSPSSGSVEAGRVLVSLVRVMADEAHIPYRALRLSVRTVGGHRRLRRAGLVGYPKAGGRPLMANGLGDRLSHAVGRAASEWFERTALRGRSLPVRGPTSRARAGFPTLDPELLERPAAGPGSDARLVAYRPQLPLRWVPGAEFPCGRELWAPEEAVLLPEQTPAGVILEPISTGAACSGLGADVAVLRGLFEVLARDAFMFCWENRIPGNPIPNKAPGVQALAAHLDPLRDRLRTFDLPSLGDVPTCLAVIRSVGPTGRRLVSVGCACAETADAALEKAGHQALGVLPVLRARTALPDAVDVDLRTVRSLYDHPRYYFRSQAHRSLEFLWNEPARPRQARGTVPCDVRAGLVEIGARLHTAGRQVVSFAPALPGRAGSWMAVRKVVVTGALPLAQDERYTHPFRSAGTDATRRLGNRAVAWRHRPADRAPHPFW